MMKRVLKGTEGFTLLEIIVVLAVVALLAAALTPMILTYLEDAKKAQAQSDVNQIAAAITAFIKDTKVPPYKKGGGSHDMNNPINVSGDFKCLHTVDGTTPTPTAAGWTAYCATDPATVDTLENQLIKNTPGDNTTNVYATTGRNRWQGPYLPTVKQDPWGNKYLVSIKNAEPSQAVPGGSMVLVLSAGPNNVVDTATDTAKENVKEPGGDDIIARVK